jgi:hypothetical protein
VLVDVVRLRPGERRDQADAHGREFESTQAVP